MEDNSKNSNSRALKGISTPIDTLEASKKNRGLEQAHLDAIRNNFRFWEDPHRDNLFNAGEEYVGVTLPQNLPGIAVDQGFQNPWADYDQEEVDDDA